MRPTDAEVPDYCGSTDDRWSPDREMARGTPKTVTNADQSERDTAARNAQLQPVDLPKGRAWRRGTAQSLGRPRWRDRSDRL